MGGAVRDLLLGFTPKDFDVATNALPEEVRRLFRNCRLIGRRFRLAHVHYGQEIIEVATFRAAAAPEREDAEDLETDGEGVPVVDVPPIVPFDSEHRAFDTSGRILRDNIYGTIEEDVWRRDFAANGLYYNIEDFSIWDFVDGGERRPGTPPQAHRRSGDPLQGRPGAHAAGGTFRREARLFHGMRAPSGRSGNWRTCSMACRRRACSTSA